MNLKKINLAVIGLIVLLSPLNMFGATYNFYFNNTEQGPNSTATPNLTVTTDGKTPPVVKGTDLQTPAGPVPPGQQPNAPQAGPQSPAAPASTVVADGQSTASPMEHWRLSGSWSGVDKFHGHPIKMESGTVSIAYSFNHFIGLGVFAMIGQGDHAGAEAELTPIHISVFGANDALSIAGLVGVNTFRPSSWGPTHVGARVSLDLSEHFALTTAARGSTEFLMTELGIAFKL